MLFLPAKQRAVFVACAIFLSSAARPVAAPVTDASAVFSIGSHPVSHYVVSKYFQRFDEDSTQRRQHPPGATERGAWLHRFLCQQLVIAEAEKRGFGERPQVQEAVARMERHILTQPDGPYYQSILPGDPATEAELAAKRIFARRTFDLWLVRFPDGGSAQQRFGTAFDRETPDEQSARIQTAIAGDPSAEIVNGPSTWPFLPVIEAVDIVHRAAGHPGTWVIETGHGGNLYVALVRSEMTPRSPETDLPPEIFRGAELRRRREAFVRQHAADLISHAEVKIDPVLTGELFARHLHHPAPNTRFSLEATNGIADQTLFTYRANDDLVAVTVARFCESYNRQLIRSAIISVAGLRRAIEGCAVEEIDLRDARARGIDREPHFVEDRAAFTAFQVLELFEREVLTPRVSVPDLSVRDYYRTHASEFTAPQKARMRLLRFNSASAAARWMNAGQGNAGALPADDDRTYDVEPGTKIPGVEPFYASLLSRAPGSQLGPCPTESGYMVAIRNETLSTVVRPFDAVRSAIEGTLKQQQLERLEEEIAREVVQREPVEDRINYSEYGTTVDAVHAFWRK